MNATSQEIGILLEMAFKSSLSAQEIVFLINRHTSDGFFAPMPKSGKTVSEVFSMENIRRFTSNSKLATRIQNSVYHHPYSISDGPELVCRDELVTEAKFRHPKRWRNCGRKSESVILAILRDEGVVF